MDVEDDEDNWYDKISMWIKHKVREQTNKKYQTN